MTDVAGSMDPVLASVREALRRGDGATALARLETIRVSGPAALPLHLDRAVALRLLNRIPESIAALDEALAIDPYNLMALLAKAALVERLGAARDAARIYGDILAFAPPPERAPPGLAPQLRHARAVVDDNARRLQAALRQSVGDLGADLSPRARCRFEEALDVCAGVARPYRAEPLLLNYPQLPATPFHDEAQFPWLAELEAATPMIAREYLRAADNMANAFAPYVQYPAGAPVNQWGELNHSARWSAMFLWKDGVRQDGACAQCPGTAALLDRLPLARQPGFAPTVVFSVLDAKTRIPPHTGSTNIRALVHLPLILPGPARFRVGNEIRHWEMGRAWVFDDTIEHEAWNDADLPRTIMILDAWNPNLAEEERPLANALLAARKAYYQD
jgi:aspartyl/asparaginyl beta-hydroxylase (cupin superfamily)